MVNVCNASVTDLPLLLTAADARARVLGQSRVRLAKIKTQQNCGSYQVCVHDIRELQHIHVDYLCILRIYLLLLRATITVSDFDINLLLMLSPNGGGDDDVKP